ncbi:AAL090Cp [Eremothecium gossypii ATCC 10895]|uniref:AAL090Cp n=1 Tax=Eremothecium gossypii (strain ATCC 10895 / CBS 109.51 / FGSC 9923 / NRRL Y-1056) TaxID=284811 RepID=Q75F18_EREGS|nr:AAL090Cp [Eremothecium gossypii ATCC 10895]AAS50276.2 AAL090Cp [Eremothecium gossypii ATCC 10895]AEY94561.1 FAAL090Cp [Eremothecium gossypii FDAG1]
MSSEQDSVKNWLSDTPGRRSGQSEMDYEEVLFGLEPLINARSAAELLELELAGLEQCGAVLDQLAVHLRAPANRDLVRESGLLRQLLRAQALVFEAAFQGGGSSDALLQVGSELVRCAANAMVDNDDNRREFHSLAGADGHPLLEHYLPKVLQMGEREGPVGALKMRAIAMLQNFCLDSPEYRLQCAQTVPGPLIACLREMGDAYMEEDAALALKLGLELLADLAEDYASKATLDELEFLASLLCRMASACESADPEAAAESEGSEDSGADALQALCGVVEAIADKSAALDLSDKERCSALQRALFDSLDALHAKEFPNKLIVVRRITSSIGYISANEKCPNRHMRTLCYSVLERSQDGYALCGALFVLANSISGRSDVDEVLAQVPLQRQVRVARGFTDPVQFQSFLDLFRKCLNLVTALTFSAEHQDALFSVVRTCHDQARYYAGLAPLVDSFLNKLLAIFPGAALAAHGAVLDVAAERGGISACLLLEKVSKVPGVAPETFARLLDAIFKFQESANGGVSLQHLFHVTRALGVYLHDTDARSSQLLLSQYSDKLTLLLSSVLSLRDKDDPAATSVLNNAKFMAGMVWNTSQNTPELQGQDMADLVKAAKALL